MSVQKIASKPAASRIRDAAIELFARDGITIGLRPIAAAAGVSASLIFEHFGSKENLRAACDEYVSESFRTSKLESLKPGAFVTWVAQATENDVFATLLAYVLSSVQSGNPPAERLWRTIVDRLGSHLEEGRQAGALRRSLDPSALANYLATSGFGAFLVYRQLHETPMDLPAVLRSFGDEMLLPAIDIYTNGLLADSQ